MFHFTHDLLQSQIASAECFLLRVVVRALQTLGPQALSPACDVSALIRLDENLYDGDFFVC